MSKAIGSVNGIDLTPGNPNHRAMARRLRLEFPDAIYHIVNRGNRNENIFRDDADRLKFLETLAETCAKTGWRIHAYALMPDHFHLVLETPQPNLVAGMKWFLGTYTGRFNRRHRLTGHLFRGRYRSQIVGTGGRYLCAVADYVHLNPVRAGLVGTTQRLRDFAWTSLPSYLASPRSRPGWLKVETLLQQCGIAKDGPAGWPAFERRLDQLRERELPEEWEAIRTQWFLGDDASRRHLLDLAGTRARAWHYGPEVRESAENKAGQLIREELKARHWTRAELSKRRKGDQEKIAIAKRLRSETTMTLAWIAQQLHMGQSGYLSHLLYWDGKEKPSQRRSGKEAIRRRVSGAQETFNLATDSDLSEAPNVSTGLERFDVRFD